MFKRITNIQSLIKDIIGDFTPKVGIVLGSGLSAFVDSIEVKYSIDYTDIEGMPHSTVKGHIGRFIFGYVEGTPIVIMQGRLHYYEGWSLDEVVLPIRVMKMLGIETVLLSTASGGLSSNYKVGDLMAIKDHINFIPNPLIGKNIDELGERFPPLTNAYTPELIDLACKCGKEIGVILKKGVFIAISGPSYETNAEINFYRMIGGNSISMSTAPEVIAAAHLGLKVFAVSVITNVHSNLSTPSHEEVVMNGNLASEKLARLYISMIKNL
ncbi:MAG: purine-nucleoside phosphorylase [Rikenellaceae bacterium]